MAADYPSLSDYSYVAGNPVMFIDPTGMAVDDWIKNNSTGEVSWSTEVTSESNTPDDYTYVSDSEDNRDYTLPDGSGKLRVNNWEVYPVEDGVGQPSISLEFIPNNTNAESGWTQTFNSNVPDVTSENLWSSLPNETAEGRLDGSGVQHLSDPNQAVYFGSEYGNDTEPSNILSDQPTRAFNPGATSPVIFEAQSSIIMNGQKVFTVSWGFEINSSSSGTFFAPTIIENTTTFHENAVNALINN